MSTVWWVILLSGLGTYAMRASFLAAADRLAEVPPALARVLRQIPPAAIAAIVLPALVRPDRQFDLTQPRLLAGIIAGLVAWRSRNVGLTLAVGMAIVIAFETI